jgi:2',3'-cyclic-nucleotide 2'-phosphodiesterase/3'-nucleotidase/5'-nucleotidase
MNFSVRIKKRNPLKILLIICFLILGYSFLPLDVFASPALAQADSYYSTTLHILSTSDIHCRYLPYDYTHGKADKSGSMARLSTLVRNIRETSDPSILIDVGDAIQGSLSQAYLKTSIHPFVQAANYMRYDVWALGNHEFNFGIDSLQTVISQMNARVLCGNVYLPDGSSLAAPYTIIRKNGIRIGIIGMVTPSVSVYASDKLAGCRVTNPLDETRKIVSRIRGQCDVLIVAAHMGLGEEYGVCGSGAEDLARACPQIDVILAAHDHTKVREKFVNGVLITENRKLGKTLSDVVLSLQKDKAGRFHVLGKKAFSLNASEVEPDPEFLAAMSDVKTISDTEDNRIIGALAGVSLSPDPAVCQSDRGALQAAGNETGSTVVHPNTALMTKTSTSFITQASVTASSGQTHDTSAGGVSPASFRFDSDVPLAARGESTLTSFINQVQRFITGAQVSATSLPPDNAGISGGIVRVSDLKKLYPNDLTLFKLRLTGKQLRTYIEWSASYYCLSDTEPEDSGLDPENTSVYLVSQSAGKTADDCDIFSGVRYVLDLSQPAGKRIRFLSWPDGSPISDTEPITLAVNRVRAADLVETNKIFSKGQAHPEIIQGDVHNEYSGLREMIGAYLSVYSNEYGLYFVSPARQDWFLTASGFTL